jgi:hypothetical protein
VGHGHAPDPVASQIYSNASHMLTVSTSEMVTMSESGC